MSPTGPQPRVVIVGAGFGGLGTARSLRGAGFEDVIVLERAKEIGGVWRDNTYPGAACDVPSSLYCWSWAPNPRWPRRYARQPEILDYLRRCAARDGVLALVRTGRNVASVVLDEPTSTWRVTTDTGELFEADVVVSAVGQLSNPVLPDVDGVGDFAGTAFHSARWRDDVDLTGARVVVVGTGASACQLVPGIVDRVASLSVLQRSAPYVLPRPDRVHQVHRRGSRPSRRWRLAAERAVVLWLTERLNRALGGGALLGGPLLAALRFVWLMHLHHQVRDASLRRRLMPDYPIGCKRLLFSHDWYRALDREHVEVVTEEVACIEADGVRTVDGRLHEADVLVWGTGFAATRFLEGIDVSGVDGADLHARWADGAWAHLGLTVPDFPQLLCIYGPHTNLGGSSILAMIEAQAGYVVQVTSEVARRRDAGDARMIDVRRDVASAFTEQTHRRLESSVWAGCASWYADGGRITTNWPGTVREYQERLATIDWSDWTDVEATTPPG